MKKSIYLNFFRPQTWQSLLLNCGLLILLVIIVSVITFAYISDERTFYWWDLQNYNLLTSNTAAFLASPSHGLPKAVQLAVRTLVSTNESYNDYFTLPLAPFLLIFGDTRFVFILSIVLVYLLPFTLVLGVIATKLIPGPPRKVFWSTVLLAWLTPVIWAVALRGYPDVGGSLLLALAVLIYLRDMQLQQRRQRILIGVLLAAAALFRRHFLFDGIAFFAAILIQTFVAFAQQAQQQRSFDWRSFYQQGIRIGWIAIASTATLIIFGLPFVYLVLFANFGPLNASYELPLGVCLLYYVLAYGLIAWIAAGLGFAVGSRVALLNRSVAFFISLFSLCSLINWVFITKQPNLHYNLHFAMFIVLGLSAFGWTIVQSFPRQNLKLILGLMGVYLIFNAGIGLSSLGIFQNTPIRPTHFNPPINTGTGYSAPYVTNSLSVLFSANYPPLQYQDYDEIIRLVNYLHSVNSSNEAVYIAASSEIFNDSIIRSANKEINANFTESNQLNILFSPITDSGSNYPLGELLQAQYVVLATPFQHHLRVSEQQVAKVVFDAFTENWEITQDFALLPARFSLKDGTIIRIYRRSRPTSVKTALQTFKAMQDHINKPLPGQTDWINLSFKPIYAIEKHKMGNRLISLPTLNDSSLPTSFLYISPLTEKVRISGNLKYSDPSCSSTRLRLDAITQNGESLSTIQTIHSPQDQNHFSLELQTNHASHLLLQISEDRRDKDQRNSCSLSINPLMVESD